MQVRSSQPFAGLSYPQSRWECRSLIRACISKLFGVSTNAGYLQCLRSFGHPCLFCLALSVAVVAFLCERESLGLSFLLMFHCLLRPGEARAVERVDIHIFDDISVSRYEGVFGVVSVRLPKTRRQRAHSQVQHVLVECQSFALLLQWGQVQASHKGSCRVLSCSANEHASGLQQCLSQTGLRPAQCDARRFLKVVGLLIIGSAYETCQPFVGVEDGVPKRPCKGTSKRASTTFKQPQFLDRVHCYAHWQRLLRHSSPR